MAGCSHHTVARLVADRDAGGVAPRTRRARLVDGFLPKLEEWIDRSKGKLRADVAHDKLVALGYAGSQRTTRRAVATVKKDYRLGRVRVHRPWVTEPGMWLQYDFGDGPHIDGVKTTLFVAWLAWSRFRVVLAIRDKTMPSVMAALDVTLRRIGGAPTYVLTDNEKTVTTEHVAGMPVPQPGDGRVRPALRGHDSHLRAGDPASKGGSESSVKIAKADIVPTDTNLADAYETFTGLEIACAVLYGRQRRVHRVTRRAPGGDARRGTGPAAPGPEQRAHRRVRVTRAVPATTPMVSLEGSACSDSVPRPCSVRRCGCGCTAGALGSRTSRWSSSTSQPRRGRGRPACPADPGSPRIEDSHFPPAPAGAVDRKPLATAAEVAFLALGDGAGLWLTEAAAAGTTQVRVKMATPCRSRSSTSATG